MFEKLEKFPDNFKESWPIIVDDLGDEPIKALIVIGLYWIYQNDREAYDKLLNKGE
jgi:hypothetical protein